MAYKLKSDARNALKRHYEKNKEQYIARARAWDNKNREIFRKYVLDYLLKNPCKDCGETDPRVLDFDHRDRNEKYKSIGAMISGKYKFDKLVKEIEKCDIRCANCHRKKTYNENGWEHKGSFVL